MRLLLRRNLVRETIRRDGPMRSMQDRAILRAGALPAARVQAAGLATEDPAGSVRLGRCANWSPAIPALLYFSSQEERKDLLSWRPADLSPSYGRRAAAGSLWHRLSQRSGEH